MTRFFTLCIAGVVNHIWAYVEEKQRDVQLVVGKPGRKQFRVVVNDACGVSSKAQTKVTVAWDVAGDRGTRYVVSEDGVDVRPSFRWLSVEEEQVKRLRTGFTAAQIARGEHLK